MDKIFSIAPLLDESFLNISIKKSCTPERDTVSLCDSVAIQYLKYDKILLHSYTTIFQIFIMLNNAYLLHYNAICSAIF